MSPRDRGYDARGDGGRLGHGLLDQTAGLWTASPFAAETVVRELAATLDA